MVLDALARRRYVVASLGSLLPIVLIGVGFLSGSINVSRSVGVHWSGASAPDEFAPAEVVIAIAVIVSLFSAVASICMVSLTPPRARGDNSIAVAAAASALAQFEAFLMIVASSAAQFNGGVAVAIGSVVGLAVGVAWFLAVRACLAIRAGTPRRATADLSTAGTRLAWLEELQRPMYAVGSSLLLAAGAVATVLLLLIRVPELGVIAGASLLLGCAQLLVSRIHIVANDSAILIHGRLGILLQVIPWDRVKSVSASSGSGVVESGWSAEATRTGTGAGLSVVLIEEVDGHQLALRVPDASQVARGLRKLLRAR